MVAFPSETLSMANRNAEGNGKRAKNKATGSTASLQHSVFFMAPFKIMLFFNLLQICHKQQFERTSDSFDLRLWFWKLHLCLLFFSGQFRYSHEFSYSQLYVSISLHVVTLCAAVSNIIILQPLEFNQHLLTRGV